MDNGNKTIIALIVAIILLGVIFGIKVLNNSDEPNEQLNSNQIQVNLENNDNMIENREAEENINNMVNESNNSITYDSGAAIDETLTSKDLIIGIINIIIILVVVPILLRKYNLLTCVIIMTIYELIITLIIGDLFTFGIIGILIDIVITFAYYYLFLWIVDKLLLEAGAISYFFGVIIINSVIDWIFQIILGFILSIVV